MIDGNRGTGRTMRMVAEIVNAAHEGKRTVVVGTIHREVQNLRVMYRAFGGKPDANITWVTGPNHQSATMGLSDNVLIFRDHYDIEREASLASAFRAENIELKKKLQSIQSILNHSNLTY